MEQSKDNKIIPMTSINSGKVRELMPNVHYFTNQIVNLVMIALPKGEWVLVDAGMPKSSNEIIRVAEELFGMDKAPLAIILTHGHFDHVGSIVDLVEKWNAPVFAHTLEFPFLTGLQAYPEPDTSVEGGILAKISSYYPNEPIDIKNCLQALPIDNSVPFLEEWQWIHIPGHSPGQIALFRERDRVLISADAIITVRQDSMYKVLLQTIEICGPPVYLTTDWSDAFQSVKRLIDLNPNILIPGHGTAMHGEELNAGLQKLLEEWDETSVPKYGKWVTQNYKNI